jgi:hypothetical protein
MLAQQLHDACNQQDAEQKKHTKVARPVHRVDGLLHAVSEISHKRQA